MPTKKSSKNIQKKNFDSCHTTEERNSGILKVFSLIRATIINYYLTVKE